MAHIAVLSELVANQIAAGEVVERPASAVKELIENAVDAGATEIAVRVEGGGLTLIDVQDNGVGIAPDEVPLAFIRHATSKLRALDDLRRLGSLGFRGEALPAIAAVSKLTIHTRPQTAEGGLEMVLHGGELVSQQPVGCPPGTRITVTDLFFNTPARLKFVRSLQTESSHIVDVVAKAAAARPDIAFRATVDGKVQWLTPGDGKQETVFATAFGVPAARTALSFAAEHADYVLTGVLALPEHSRAQRTGLWFAVNGRPIRSAALQNGVLEGFAHAIPKGRYPLLLLALKTDPSLVDVNVHPGKLEIRFSEERDVRELVRVTVANTLESGMRPASMRVFRDTHADGQAGEREVSAAYPSEPVVTSARQSDFSLIPESVRQSRSADFPLYRRQTIDAKASQLAFSLAEPLSAQEQNDPYVRRSQREPAMGAAASEAGSERVEEGQAAFAAADGHPQLHKQLRAVAQVMQMYIVAQDEDAVYLIDQHAAHERVLYERFRAEAAERGWLRLELLVPLTIEVPLREFALVQTAREQWEQFGLLVEPFGEQAFVVRAVPHIWEGLDIEALVRDVFADHVSEQLDVDGEVGSRRALRAWQDRLIMRSCKAAVKANQKLSLMEMDALLQSLSTLQNPFTCPHGRPTAIVLTRQQLEKEFKRSL